MLRAGLTGARWIDPENYHLTLRFIGDVDGATARDFESALGEIVAAPFELEVTGLGSFGGGKPRAIFAGIGRSQGLDALQRANERAAREAGLPPEGRNYKPHVTLARLKGARAELVAAYLQRQCWSHSPPAPPAPPRRRRWPPVPRGGSTPRPRTAGCPCRPGPCGPGWPRGPGCRP